MSSSRFSQILTSRKYPKIWKMKDEPCCRRIIKTMSMKESNWKASSPSSNGFAWISPVCGEQVSHGQCFFFLPLEFQFYRTSFWTALPLATPTIHGLTIFPCKSLSLFSLRSPSFASLAGLVNMVSGGSSSSTNSSIPVRKSAMDIKKRFRYVLYIHVYRKKPFSPLNIIHFGRIWK